MTDLEDPYLGTRAQEPESKCVGKDLNADICLLLPHSSPRVEEELNFQKDGGLGQGGMPGAEGLTLALLTP